MGIVFKPLYTKIIDRLKINTQSVLYRIFQWVRTIWLLSLGRILFRTNSLQDAWTMFLSTFDIFNINYWIDPLIKLGIEPTGLKIALFAALILLVVDIINEILYMKNKNLLTVINSAPIYIRWTLWIALLMIVIIFGNYGASYVSVDFIYMQF